jgi:predicted SAM-dependent methyltransferase
MLRENVWLNIGCGPFRAPEPWLNTDVVRVDGVIEPDLLLPSPWPGATKPHVGAANVARLYLGHVLEHVRWEMIPQFMSELRELLMPGAEVLVVGPDVYRSVELHVSGQVSVSDLVSTFEDDRHYQHAEIEWEGARHSWNCYEARLIRLLSAAGFVDVEPLAVEPGALESWPVVSFTQTQCAVLAREPG